MKKGLRRAVALFTMFSALATASCGKSAEADLYSGNVVNELTDIRVEAATRLPGFTDDIAVIRDEAVYDPEFITADYGAFVNDSENKVLYAKNAHEKLYPASVTKCMTALLVLENMEDLTAKVTVGEEILTIGPGASSAGLQVGETYTIEDLLYGLIVPSGNDAASVLATAVAGSVDDFVALMNKRAAELGMLNTHFMNPHGLHDKDHYTTAYDLYLLMHECLKHEMFRTVAGTVEVTVHGTNASGNVEKTYKSTNSFLRGYTVPEADLSVICAKTGYTSSAGRCLLMVSQSKSGDYYISVIAKAHTYDDMFNETNKLLSLAESDGEE